MGTQSNKLKNLLVKLFMTSVWTVTSLYLAIFVCVLTVEMVREADIRSWGSWGKNLVYVIGVLLIVFLVAVPVVVFFLGLKGRLPGTKKPKLKDRV